MALDRVEDSGLSDDLDSEVDVALSDDPGNVVREVHVGNEDHVVCPGMTDKTGTKDTMDKKDNLGTKDKMGTKDKKAVTADAEADKKAVY